MIPFTHSRNRNDNTIQNLTVTIKGHTFPFTNESPHFEAILNALKSGDDETVKRLVQLKQHIADFTEGKVTIVKDELYFNGKPLSGSLVNRIFEMFRDGFDIKPLARFLENCLANPSTTAVDELHLFLDACNLPITEDGCFLAYKVINSNWTDCYTGTIDNSIGAKPKMDRVAVDSDRHRTCSDGLHFCSREYIRHFSNSDCRLICVKVNPANVVAIPSDYNNTKGRCCEYEVIEEVLEGGIKDWYVSDSDDFEDEEDSYELEEDDMPACYDPNCPVCVEVAEDVVPASIAGLSANYGKTNAVPVLSGAKLTEADVLKALKLLNQGWKPAVIAQTMGVHRRTIERIRSGEAWSHVTGIKS